MDFVFEQIRAGGDRNFGYLLGDRKAGQAVLIDPSFSPDAFVERAREQRLTITHIVNTHGHPDHTNGNDRASDLTGAPIAAHPALASTFAWDDGLEIPIGALRLKGYHVPGHSRDHLLLHEQTSDVVITGDLLFVGKVGGTASDEDARTEWNSLQRLLSLVPATATIWPGHDYGIRPSSTIALELRSNPFLTCRDVDAFLDRKASWATFKKERGLR